jgi:F-type H+/Na+-transporting ATPase subunit beta
VLFFVDNIYRYTLAGTEVSALLGRMPSAVGYQPTLADRNGRAAGAHHLDQDRLDHLDAGDLRAGRRLDRSGAGDHVRALGRDRGAVAPDRLARHLSGGRSARLDQPQLDPLVVGEEHYDTARGVQAVLQRYKELQDIIAILGMDELSKRTS